MATHSQKKPKRKSGVSTPVYDPARVDAMRLKDSGPWPWKEHGLSIGEAFDLYSAEHRHRRKEWVYNITECLTQFLSVNNLDESFPVGGAFTKDRFKIYKTMLLNGTAQGPNKRKPGPVTIQRKLAILHHLVKWLVANDHLDRDTMAGVALPPKLVASARVQKEAFSDEQLRMIFDALAQYRTYSDPMRVEWYWLTLVLAHTGCRAMEVTQLHKSDVIQQEGIWCMRLVDDGQKKRLKNKMSQRVVPMHSAVIKAGVLQWIESQPEGQLFPGLRQYGVQKSSGWFTRMLKHLGLRQPSLTQHSLRHTVTVKLERARVHYSLMRRLLGHSVGKDVESRVYLGSLTYTAKELSEAVEAIQLPPIT